MQLFFLVIPNNVGSRTHTMVTPPNAWGGNSIDGMVDSTCLWWPHRVCYIRAFAPAWMGVWRSMAYFVSYYGSGLVSHEEQRRKIPVSNRAIVPMVAGILVCKGKSPGCRDLKSRCYTGALYHSNTVQRPSLFVLEIDDTIVYVASVCYLFEHW
jgi:hypothetical protein